MTRESLARKFRPAGFEQPEGSRHQYTKPRRELQDAFDRWVEGLPYIQLYWFEWGSQYQKACEIIKPLGEIPVREANSLLVDFEPKTEGQKGAGLFISACYTHSPEEIIIFDVDAQEINLIGYHTKKNIFNYGKVRDNFAYYSSGVAINFGECADNFAKESSNMAVNNGNARGSFADLSSCIIVNNRLVLHDLGTKSSGLAINNGECGDFFSKDSSGTAINNGECQVAFASMSSGISVAVKKPKGWGYKEAGLALEPADIEKVPELKEYLQELCELSKSIKDEESAKRFLERYGANGTSVGFEVKGILMRAGKTDFK